MNIIRYWNDLALRLVADDHTGSPAPSNRGGPVQTSYALALLHLALHDTVAKTGGGFVPYLATHPTAPAGTVQAEALTGAFTHMATVLYPSHSAAIIAARDGARNALGSAGIYPNSSEDYGIAIATALLTSRQNDGSKYIEDYTYLPAPGKHRADPAQPGQGPLGSKWGDVKPFTYAPGAHPPIPGPPPLIGNAYTKAYNEVIKEGRENLWQTNPQQAMKGVYWGYDGSQKLGTPPRLYNQIVREIADPLNLGLVAEVRLLTLINVGMADAGIACWHHKYKDGNNFWRPVVGIREAAIGAGPGGMGVPAAVTKGDPFWLPLGLPNTNGTRIGNFTPGFPAYPSGHSTFGATCFLLTAKFLSKTPAQVKFTFVSDEFNGVNRDGNGVIRPRLRRPFSLASAIEENAMSRVYLGVHWKFDATDGITLAKQLIDGIDAKLGKPRAPKAAGRVSTVANAQEIPPQPGQRQQMR